jgi:hypothetical protein
MLTIKECREILNEEKRKYTDEEVKAIRDFLYKLGLLNIEIIKHKLKENGQESNPIYKSLYR